MLARLKNILILLLALLAAPLIRRANKQGIVPNSVLVVQLAKLGDMVCTTPIFHAIKAKYPECRVVVMGISPNKGLLKDNSDVDDYIIFDGDFFSLLRKINKYRFDFACTATPNFIALATLYLARIPSIAAPVVVNGYSPYETKLYKILRNFVINIPHSMGSYAPREYLRLLEPIGIFSQDTTKHLAFSDEIDKRVLTFLSAKGISRNNFVVVIAPGAGNKIKQWPPSRFTVVADHLIEKYKAKILVIGSLNDKEESEEMTRGMKNKTEIIDTVGHFSIEELKALVSRADLLIGVDTGPIYIAEAFNIPTIDLVGPMDENEQPPRSKFNIVLVAEREAPVMHIMNARLLDEIEARRQVEAITVDMAIKAVDQLIPSLNGRNQV